MESRIITCVKCQSVLTRSRFGSVEVDLCPGCGGLWLDHGEIERLGQGPRIALQVLRGALRGGSESPPSEDTANCPACPGKLREVTLGQVPVDYCGSCRGLFLDKGELDAALEAVAGASVSERLAAALSS